MISCAPPENDVASDNKNFTIASTFEKEKSLKFELLFGDYRKKLVKEDAGHDVINAVDYFFSPGQVFGFACQSHGDDFRRFHYVFILCACSAGDLGTKISGVLPGAQILARTLTDSGSNRLKVILRNLKENNIDPKEVAIKQYRWLNHLLETKTNLDFFIAELKNQPY